MQDTEKEQVTETPKPTETTENSDKSTEQQKIIQQQSELIDKLIKQTELTNKVNEQLTRNIQQKTKELNPKDPFGWVKDKLNNFSPAGIHPHFYNKEKLIGGAVVEKGMEFLTRYIRDTEKLKEEEIAKRINAVFEAMHNY